MDTELGWFGFFNAQRLMAMLLCLAVNIEYLHLHLTDGYGYTLLFEIITTYEDYSGTPTFDRLSAVSLHRDCGFSVGGARQNTELFYLGSKISSLRVWRNMGRHVFRDGMEFVHNLQELRLVGYVNARDVFKICQRAPILRDLTLIISEPGDLELDIPPEEYDLNHALARRADTLKELELRIYKYHLYLSQLGVNGRLECLPMLENLQNLTIELPIIFDLIAEPTESEILACLPPNLVWLHLVEEYQNMGYDRGLDLHLNYLINKLLVQFAFMPSSQLRRLQHLRYRYRPVNTSTPPTALSEIHGMFGYNELTFSYQPDDFCDVYCVPP